MPDKICKTCKKSKPIEAFVHDRLSCRSCVSSINTARRKELGKDKSDKAYQSQWRKNNRQHINKRNLKWRQANHSKVLVYHAAARARKSGIEFDLLETDIVIPSVCPVLGIKICSGIGVGRTGKQDNLPSLDRIDSSKGYTKDNVKVISLRANVIKNCGTIEEHEKIIAYMKLHS